MDERLDPYSISDSNKILEAQRATEEAKKLVRKAKVEAKIRALEESGEGVNIYDIELMNEILTA